MNILFIVIDTLRADHLSCYGYFRKTSPTLDRLAEEGVLFEGSFASAIATGPGFTSLFTGLAAINHRYYITPWNVPNTRQLDDDIPTLPEVLQENGYTTAALDNLVNFRSHPKHFVRGFEFYINVTKTPKWVHHHVTADQINHRLIPWIKDHFDEKFFLFVHYWDPHTPYNQPEPFRKLFSHRKNLSDLMIQKAPAGYEYVPGWGKKDEVFEGDEHRSIDLYDGEIAYVDRAVGQVIEVLEQEKVLEDTLMIVTSDHGEGLGQHGTYGHAGLHEEVIFVPLILKYPAGLPRGERVRGFVQHVDLLPTILDLAEVSNVPKTDGESLLSLIHGREPRGEIFIETGRADGTLEAGGQRAIRTGDWKLILDYSKEREKVELYNIKRDPMEIVNVAVEEKSKTVELKEKLDYWVKLNLRDREDPIFGSETSATCYIGNITQRR